MVHGLSCSAACGNLPRPGLEPVSPALACGLLTTAPPGKPLIFLINQNYISPATDTWRSVQGHGKGGQGVAVEVYTIWKVHKQL